MRLRNVGCNAATRKANYERGKEKNNMYFTPWLEQQNIIPKSSWMRWNYQQLSTAEMVYNAMSADQLQKEIAAQKIKEGVAAQPTNSRYMTALGVLQDFYEVTGHVSPLGFETWCKQRLKPETPPACT